MSDEPSSDDPSSVGDDALQHLLDDERHVEAVAHRRREQSLRMQATESGTLAGVLVDLAERRATASLSLTGGRVARGVIYRLGADVVVMQGLAAETVLVALAAVASVRTEPGTVRTSGDRVVRSTATLADLTAELVADRPHVVLHAGPGSVAGELRAVGVDVATVVQADRTVAYVSLAAVTEVVVA